VLRSRELIIVNLVVPKPSFTVPFQRDSMFIGRENVMAEIKRKYEQATLQNHTRLALVGLGGVG
jgi:hypothetical protein